MGFDAVHQVFVEGLAIGGDAEGAVGLPASGAARDLADLVGTKRARALGARITTFPVDMTHGEINALLGTKGAYTDAADKFLGSIGLQ